MNMQSQNDVKIIDVKEIEIAPIILTSIARIGMLVGPCKNVEIRTHGRLAICKVNPTSKRDPILPMPLCKANPQAWESLRNYFRAVMDCVDYSRLSSDDPYELHSNALAMIPDVVKHFVGYLTPIELKNFEKWLYASLIGDAKVGVK